MNDRQKTQWQGPREKLLEHGVSKLDNAELLAIVFGSGSRKENVVHLARRVIDDYGSQPVFEYDIENVERNYQITTIKAMQLVAIFELGRRYYSQGEQINFRSPQKIYEHFWQLKQKETEEFRAMLFDAQHRHIMTKLLAAGGENAVLIEPKRIVKLALIYGAAGIVLVHNHPGGDTEPSEQDIDATRGIQDACKLVNVKLLDHVIVGEGYFSFYENKLMT